MSLSVCLIASAPAARVAALLEPVRELADEIVIAADSRGDEATLAGYAALADRFFRIEYRLYERHLPWLHAQCSGDWILRLDDDEVMSAAFLARLPELLAAREVHQYWVARPWLYPDAGSVLDDPPWSVDFNNRLVRNDGTLRFRGVQHAHADPVEPCEYIEEPVYHLELLLAGTDQRRDKALRYEVANPLLIAAGGGRINEAFYLPELRSSLRTRPLPEADRAAVERVLGATRDDRGAAAARRRRSSPREEMDRHWEGRDVPESGYRAAIEPVGTAPALAPGEGRNVLFRVTNHGTERWPRGLDRTPAIRASYRWLHPDGSVHTADGLRTGFTRDVGPASGSSCRSRSSRHPSPGATCSRSTSSTRTCAGSSRAAAWRSRSTRRSALPPTPLRLRESPPPPRRRLRRPRMLIPRVLHRVWVGRRRDAGRLRRVRARLRAPPPGVGDAPVDGRRPRASWASPTPSAGARAPRPSSPTWSATRSCSRFGGVYLDTDFECRRPLDDLLRGRRGVRRARAAGPRGVRRRSAPCRATGPSSARPGCRARRSGWDCTRPTPTARTS